MKLEKDSPKEKTYIDLRKDGGFLHKINAFLIVSLLLGIFTACTSTGSTANTPTPAPTPTVEPPNPETALEKALQHFDYAQSFTVTNSSSGKESTSDGWASSSTNYIDQANQMYLRELESTLDKNGESITFCMPSACYSSDATGLLKPNNSVYTTYRLKVESLGKDLTEILDSNYTYVGENTIDGIRVFVYEIQVTQEMIDAYKEPSTSSVSSSTLLEPYPVINLYVNAEDGYLVKISEIYNEKYSYNFSGEITEYQYSIGVEKSFSNWNMTTFTIPDYVDTQNTDWQDYDGTYSLLMSFQFPKVYSLSETYNYPVLKSPSGSTMSIQVYGNIASLSELEGQERDQQTGVAVCSGVVQLWLLPGFLGSPVVESADWFNMNNLDFCKALISTDDGQEAVYLFNEPVDYAFANGRMLPATFLISITPAEGDDANTIFMDVIQTIHIGAE